MKTSKMVLIGAAVAAVGGIGYFIWKKTKEIEEEKNLSFTAQSSTLSGMGLTPVPVKYKWQFMTDGQFSKVEGGMKNWTPLDYRPPGLPPTKYPIVSYAGGNKTHHFYGLGDSYAYLLLKRAGTSWVPVKWA